MSFQISADKMKLEKDGQPFFYLADTCWSAFTNITDEEWEYYLDLRRHQGFNVIQINILPQWDASETALNHVPFALADGVYDYSQINDDYFVHARHLCEMARAQGFQLALVLLWCNYVPDTWAAPLSKSGIMPYHCIEPYIRKVHETFTDLEPFYVVSGDTDFNTGKCISYYVKAAEMMKSLAPNCLFTTHIKGRYTEIPAELYRYLDFLFYQSGHNAENLGNPYLMAEEMTKKYPGKPLLNSEPCYEEMGFSGNLYGRWSRFDVRRAAWMSVLSGAAAGITYGAAGIYSWHKVNKKFAANRGEGFACPKSWEDALAFPGAWDYGFLRFFLEENQVEDLTPRQDWLRLNHPEIRVAGSPDKLVIYTAHNISFSLRGNFSRHKALVVDLEQRYVSPVRLEYCEQDGATCIPMHRFHHDAVFLLKK